MKYFIRLFIMSTLTGIWIFPHTTVCCRLAYARYPRRRKQYTVLFSSASLPPGSNPYHANRNKRKSTSFSDVLFFYLRKNAKMYNALLAGREKTLKVHHYASLPIIQSIANPASIHGRQPPEHPAPPLLPLPPLVLWNA